jgi:hypothetical protein
MVGQQTLDLFILVHHVIRRGALSDDRANPIYVLRLHSSTKQ